MSPPDKTVMDVYAWAIRETLEVLKMYPIPLSIPKEVFGTTMLIVTTNGRFGFPNYGHHVPTIEVDLKVREVLSRLPFVERYSEKDVYWRLKEVR